MCSLINEAGGQINEIDLSGKKKIKVTACSSNIAPKLLKILDNF